MVEIELALEKQNQFNSVNIYFLMKFSKVEIQAQFTGQNKMAFRLCLKIRI